MKLLIILLFFSIGTLSYADENVLKAIEIIKQIEMATPLSEKVKIELYKFNNTPVIEGVDYCYWKVYKRPDVEIRLQYKEGIQGPTEISIIAYFKAMQPFCFNCNTALGNMYYQGKNKFYCERCAPSCIENFVTEGRLINESMFQWTTRK